jgi:hypothetical protein
VVTIKSGHDCKRSIDQFEVGLDLPKYKMFCGFGDFENVLGFRCEERTVFHHNSKARFRQLWKEGLVGLEQSQQSEAR